MNVLGGWLRQLILIIFLAILADFLLPTKAMQKYVRVVMGLAVIAAMLQPMMPLFHGGWANQLADKATSEILGSPQATNVGIAGYDISSLKQQLQKEQSSAEMVLLQQRLQEAVAAACHCDVAQVVVQADSNGKISGVTVVTASAAQKNTRQSIINFLTNQLALGQSQVQVVRSLEGGNSSGS
ncbi:stage III sporulation protein AF [Alicyclobacillus curvatus]|jgi:stage III sporulation protein AF|nr:stage III sporulation protein AF [Alicyclobacillus curvatus]